jgi:alkylhydroperoxidase family enzyme
VTENVTVHAALGAASRIAPLEPPHPDGVGELLAGMMPPGVEPIALFRTFARNAAMTSAMRGWGAYELGRQLSLSMRDREILIDRTCARCGCEYEWGVHVAFFADRVGFTPEQVRSLTFGAPADDCWDDDRDRLLIAAADSLHDTADIADDLWAALSAELDDAQLLDLLMLCGWYHAISFCARAARLPLEPVAPTFASVAA